MKRLVIFFFVLLSLSAFASATCTNYLDNGNDADAFGYVDHGGNIYEDYCSSTTQLKEYSCSGTAIVLATDSCGACNDGICYPSTCSTSQECNPVFRKWCSGSSWSDSGYCTDSHLGCDLVDSTCDASTCTTGTCDYKNHKYCDSNDWLSEDYCDETHCGDDADSLGYCFCEDTTQTSETDCTDDVDDDCDGSVDCNDSDCDGQSGCECTDGDTQTCGSDEGVCESGTEACSGGNWGVCSGVETSEELCDELDNDCDGETDEDCTCIPGDTRDCGADEGVCQAGVQVCQDDATWGICYGASYAASEIEECNGLDDDCDGKVDEGCGCVTNTTQSCGSDVGACAFGTQSCANGTWSDCTGDIEAFPEICADTIDNDCDGLLDSDDETCAETEVNITVASSEPVVETDEITLECTSDGECDTGYVCTRAQCVYEESSSSSITEDSSTASTSSSLSSTSSSSKESSSDYWVYVLPLVVVLLLLFAFALWYVHKKKMTKNSVAPVKNTSSFSSPFQMQQKSSSQMPLKKGALEKNLEDSFKESAGLFKK
ncbi:hypothetical protein EXS74_03495 [Candidatus Woesearchaeota archaeon]|nr:hypothetical protein [Candidatus Woesearchaeota archaeon]